MDKPCKYCEFGIKAVTLQMPTTAMLGGTWWRESVREPKFCPICGRPLTGEAAEDKRGGGWVAVGERPRGIVFFADRIRLVNVYEAWLKENPTIADKPINFIAFLELRKLLDYEAVMKFVGKPLPTAPGV